MKNLYLLFIVGIIIIIGVSCSRTRNPNGQTDAPETKIAKVERGSIVQKIAATGRIVSNLDVKIKCKASGEITSLPYDISDRVTKGSLILELDPIDEERNVKKSQVTLSQTQARLEKSKKDLQIAEENLILSQKRAEIALENARIKAADAKAKESRVKQLYEQKLASKEEYDTASTSVAQAQSDYEQAQIRMDELKTEKTALELKRQDYKLAKADIESAEINLSIAEQRLKETKIYAPIDGIITGLNVQTGQIISSGISNVGGGTTIMTISDLSRLHVLASVDESDIGEVKPGQEVDVTVDAFTGRHFRGQVLRIAQKGQNVSNVVTFEVKIEVLSEEKNLLKPEMTGNVEIIIAKKDNVLLIPFEAISRQKDKQFVLVINADGTKKDREVVTGISDDSKIEIISGLKDGEQVEYKTMAVESIWNREQHMPPMGIPGVGGRR